MTRYFLRSLTRSVLGWRRKRRFRFRSRPQASKEPSWESELIAQGFVKTETGWVKTTTKELPPMKPSRVKPIHSHRAIAKLMGRQFA